MSLQLPAWARKPKHKKKVIATDRGWVVEETGELLSSQANLCQRLKQLHEELGSVVEEVSTTQTTPEPASTKDSLESLSDAPNDLVVNEEESTEEEGSEPEQEEPTEEKPKRKGGRPRKNAAVNSDETETAPKRKGGRPKKTA